MFASDPKTIEFARLFDFFERLASRKARGPHNDETNSGGIEDVHSVPADLAPVVRSLAPLVGTRKQQDSARQKKKQAAARTRRNAAGGLSHGMLDAEDENTDDDGDVESLAKFPLKKIYPFTFRLMLHKLYQLDDWAQKVKEVLERSQIEYKPLAEQTVKEEAKVETNTEKSEGRIRFKPGVVTGGSRRPTMRPRSCSVGVSVKGRDHGERGQASPTKSLRRMEPPNEEIRAVKKRCVGRRKSMSGPISTGTGRVGGVWVYAAAVSSTEFTGRDAIEYATTRRAGYQFIGESAKVGVEQPLQNTGRRIARRRALSVLDNRQLGGA